MINKLELVKNKKVKLKEFFTIIIPVNIDVVKADIPGII